MKSELKYLIGSIVMSGCVLISPSALAQDTAIKNIMVYGDSITWGWLPTSPIVPTVRHEKKNRWPDVMLNSLGDGYNVITEGLSGRTTNIEDPNAPGLMNGLQD